MKTGFRTVSTLRSASPSRGSSSPPRCRHTHSIRRTRGSNPAATPPISAITHVRFTVRGAPRRSRPRGFRLVNDRHVASVQAAFYVGTGIWPLLHRRSFERVTGPKTDFWLAQTVGLTVTAIGVGLAHAVSRRRGVPPELRTVAAASAAGLALVDIIFVGRGRISKIYLADAAAEGAVLAGWFLARTADDLRPGRPR